jgi:hypothetical protein
MFGSEKLLEDQRPFCGNACNSHDSAVEHSSHLQQFNQSAVSDFAQGNVIFSNNK